ncbi:helix-turn-helix domain-containing protein [Erythrobacter sp. WG]|uniref:helix-turn-helix domain-containing protein n=1 Tax=Erythrobacter sp. WG TaxID=2985510 RepID=UPI00226D8EF7|nr:AraC family transcriptional regulator [Erythrobacter sp. WG]MCX9146917.1 AraC family transcriptional regulator [Erythrobacter sp. WG]
MPIIENWRFSDPKQAVPGLIDAENALIRHAATQIEVLLASPHPDAQTGTIELRDDARDIILLTLGNLTGITIDLDGQRSTIGPHSDDRATFIPAGKLMTMWHCRDCSPLIAIGVPAGRLEAMSLGRLPQPFALRPDPALAGLAWQMMRRALRTAEEDDVQLERLTAELALALVNSFPAGTGVAEARLGIAPHRLRRVLTYVENNLHRPITLSSLAEQAQLSPYHFSRVFKHAVGRSPYDHVRWRRLAHGAALMIRSDMTVAQIAGGTGFANTSRFSDSFHSRSGVAPSLFRKAVRSGLVTGPGAGKAQRPAA